MIIMIIEIILIYLLLGGLVYITGQRLHTKNKRILMTYYWTVFIFSPVIDLIIYIDDWMENKKLKSNVGSECDYDEK